MENYKEENNLNANLNKKMIFDNFVVGESNKLAVEISLKVTQNLGKLYNPFILYSESGLGKTHLLNAIGNYIQENTNLKVLYISTKNFMNEEKTNQEIDVLIIDDIHFFENALVAQQAFINIFDNLLKNNKQIIISSNKNIDDLKNIDDELKKRLNQGYKVEINKPDENLKVQIIKNLINNEKTKLDLSDDVINYIVSKCENGIKVLEGAITRLMAYTTIYNIKELTLEITKEALKEYFA